MFTELIKSKFRITGILLFILPAGGVCFITFDHLFPFDTVGRPISTVIVDRHQAPLRAFADKNGVWRYPARPDQVSRLYLQALITYEDRWFYYHPGINPLAICRAFFQNLSHSRIVSGGSTLTMQTARILDISKHGNRPSTSGFFHRMGVKLRQMFRALQLEYHLTKGEILGLYLTHAPFGANIEGIRAACYTWLGKGAKEMTRAEAALMAVLPQAPSRYRPDRHPGRAAKARDKVLDRMARFGVWTPDQIRAAQQEPVISFRFPTSMTAPLAARRLNAVYPDAEVIHTFIDENLQMHMAELLRAYMDRLPPKQSGAVLVVNHKTLEIEAYAGSADFFNSSRLGHVDMIQALRSPGSTLKPFIYGLCMDKGLIHSHSMLLDVPRYKKNYNPGNFTRGFSGPVTTTRALQDSLNLPAVQVLDAYGPGRFHDRLCNAGARFQFKGTPNLSMALGGVGTSLESLVTLYTAIGRGGIAGKPRLCPMEPVQERYLMSPGAAFIIRDILSRPFPGRQGVGRLSGALSMAWKTGTSYGFRDAWAMGLKGDYTVGVWIGRPDGTPSPGQYGAITALPLLGQVMAGLAAGRETVKPPEKVSKETICWPSGLAASAIQSRAKGACAKKFDAWILDGQMPSTMTGETGLTAPLVRTFWVNSRGMRATPACGGIEKKTLALWPWQAEPFIPALWRRAAVLPKDSPNCPGMTPLVLPGIRIVSVSDNSILTCRPGQTRSPTIPLRALGGRGERQWFLNKKPLENTDGSARFFMPMPVPGRYHLAVVDESGSFDQVCFSVIELNP
ncbi:penicillin-binding protein 1C [Desulfobacter latus]|uniref:peptidoglycan glycosyltransferase n=1 Tax=Desulfobacter latus TaxID=2292 RepID=A0A850TBU7_9BACT|nr:penicillin-binding protein 1C [Desulfobacter latus]NWH06158.1 penicillin-binding protein 1C [Desulfobacter latus]